MRFAIRLALCYFVLVFFSPFCIAITSLGEEGANRIAFRTFVRFALVWFCLFPLPLYVLERLRFVIVALPGLVSYLFIFICDFFVCFLSPHVLVRREDRALLHFLGIFTNIYNSLVKHYSRITNITKPNTKQNRGFWSQNKRKQTTTENYK